MRLNQKKNRWDMIQKEVLSRKSLKKVFKFLLFVSYFCCSPCVILYAQSGENKNLNSIDQTEIKVVQ